MPAITKAGQKTDGTPEPRFRVVAGTAFGKEVATALLIDVRNLKLRRT